MINAVADQKSLTTWVSDKTDGLVKEIWTQSQKNKPGNNKGGNAISGGRKSAILQHRASPSEKGILVSASSRMASFQTTRQVLKLLFVLCCCTGPCWSFVTAPPFLRPSAITRLSMQRRMPCVGVWQGRSNMKTAMCTQNSAGQAPSLYQLSSDLMEAVKQEDYSKAAALREFLGRFRGIFGQASLFIFFVCFLCFCVHTQLPLDFMHVSDRVGRNSTAPRRMS
jgi:hypothetical protein